MTKLPDEITLGPEDEARRLWRGAQDAHQRAAEDVVALSEMLDLGLRAAEILVIQKLQPAREKFPATIALQLETPDPAIDVLRDAVSTPKALQFNDILDLLSEEGLDCVGPRLHRGWEDRRFSCRRSRTTTRETLGVTLDEAERDALLLLAACRNRIFRYPPPVCIRPGAILAAFSPLADLVERLTGVTS